MRRHAFVALAVVALCGSARAAPEDPPASVAPAPSSTKAEFDALKAEYDKAMKDFNTAYRAAKTDEERQAAFATRPNPDEFAPRFAEVASKDPKSDVAAKCHAWIAVYSRRGDLQAKALAALMDEHLVSPGGVAACKDLVYAGGLLYSSAPNRDEFLRAVVEKSPDHAAQGCACYTLAFGLARKGRPAEAERLFERVVKDFADVTFVMGSIADNAKSDLFEIRNLAVGKTAPQIVGADADGKPMKLSDFRGKVVVLDFFGFW